MILKTIRTTLLRMKYRFIRSDSFFKTAFANFEFDSCMIMDWSNEFYDTVFKNTKPLNINNKIYRSQNSQTIAAKL